MTGCCANGVPAVAVEEGWVWMASVLAAPGTSLSVPKFELVATPANVAVPLISRLPLAKGVPAVGRTRTFSHVNFEICPLISPLVTVKVS